MLTHSTSLKNFFGRHWNPDPDFDNKAGTAFFGIDARYLAQIQTQEFADLIAEGYDYPSLMRMPIAKRRLFYHKLVEKYSKNKEPPPGAMSPAQMQKKSQK